MTPGLAWERKVPSCWGLNIEMCTYFMLLSITINIVTTPGQVLEGGLPLYVRTVSTFLTHRNAITV